MTKKACLKVTQEESLAFCTDGANPFAHNKVVF